MLVYSNCPDVEVEVDVGGQDAAPAVDVEGVTWDEAETQGTEWTFEMGGRHVGVEKGE